MARSSRSADHITPPAGDVQVCADEPSRADLSLRSRMWLRRAALLVPALGMPIALATCVGSKGLVASGQAMEQTSAHEGSDKHTSVPTTMFAPEGGAGQRDSELDAAESSILAGGEGRVDATAADARHALAQSDEIQESLEQQAKRFAGMSIEAIRSEFTKLGIPREGRTQLRGPRDPRISAAYADGRALGIEGDFAQIQRWTGLARFGCEDDCSPERRGPLAAYDLFVTTEGTRAYLHVVVPSIHSQGTPRRDGLGFHVRLDDEGKEWIPLANIARAGVDYRPYKRSYQPSATRQWGKREFLERIVVIARRYKEETGELLGIGDISVVTGGKILDHWTHRKGVDADLYLLVSTQTAAAEAPPASQQVAASAAASSDGDSVADSPTTSNAALAASSAGLQASEPLLLWHLRKPNRDGHWVLVSDRKEPKTHQATADAEKIGTKLLATLAELVIDEENIAFFVHDDAGTLAAFESRLMSNAPSSSAAGASPRASNDAAADATSNAPQDVGTSRAAATLGSAATAAAHRQGRHFLHKDNHGLWPQHPDHVHVRWADADVKLPDGTPRP